MTMGSVFVSIIDINEHSPLVIGSAGLEQQAEPNRGVCIRLYDASLLYGWICPRKGRNAPKSPYTLKRSTIS